MRAPLTYNAARRAWPLVARASRDHGLDHDVGHAAVAGAIWDALVGRETTHDVGEMIADTFPEDLIPLVRSHPSVAAHAFECLAVFYPWTETGVAGRDLARNGWAAFRLRAQQVTSTARGFGWDQSSAWEMAQDDADMFRPDAMVSQIAALAGRMYMALRGENARRVSGIVGELYSVEQGSDLGRMLPIERLALTDPLLELALFDRIETQRMLQYSVRGEARAHKGPIVLCLDESSSMHAQRRVWSKAAALAVARVAAEENRIVHIVHFADGVSVRSPFNPREPKAVLAMLRNFLGGGTRIGNALAEAVTLAKSEPGADVILTTDGLDGDTDAIVRALSDARDVRLWTVAIDCDIPIENPLRARAVSYTRVSDRQLSDPTTIATFGKAAA